MLDLSSFKCGHDAPTYGIIEGIVRESATPHVGLHDLDANKPGGSIKIRVKTWVHSLKLHEERLRDVSARTSELAYRLDERRLALLEEKATQLAAPAAEAPKGLVKLGKKTSVGQVVRL